MKGCGREWSSQSSCKHSLFSWAALVARAVPPVQPVPGAEQGRWAHPAQGHPAGAAEELHGTGARCL